MPKPRISYVANVPFNDIRENIILAKISEFTASLLLVISSSSHLLVKFLWCVYVSLFVCLVSLFWMAYVDLLGDNCIQKDL